MSSSSGKVHEDNYLATHQRLRLLETVRRLEQLSEVVEVYRDVGASDERADEALNRSLLEALIAETNFELPPGVVERQLQNEIESMRRQFEGRVPEDALSAQLARMSEEGRELAERRVREALLLEAIAEQHDLEVADDDLTARFADDHEEAEISGPLAR